MATIYQRLQEYYKHPESVRFSLNKTRQISFFLSKVYDRRAKNPLVGYVQSIEGNYTYTVRDYPDFFIEAIDKWIWMNHEQVVNGKPLPWQEKGAAFSACRNYRYALWRAWDMRKPLVMFIGLNPSKANELDDDPTIRRVKRFATDWGYGGFYMLNLFAYVSTDPKILLTNYHKMVGQQNDYYLQKIGNKCKDVVLAWGSFKVNGRDKEVIKMFTDKANALLINNDGSPRHPLYVPAITELKKYVVSP